MILICNRSVNSTKKVLTLFKFLKKLINLMDGIKNIILSFRKLNILT